MLKTKHPPIIVYTIWVFVNFHIIYNALPGAWHWYILLITVPKFQHVSFFLSMHAGTSLECFLSYQAYYKQYIYYVEHPCDMTPGSSSLCLDACWALSSSHQSVSDRNKNKNKNASSFVRWTSCTNILWVLLCVRICTQTWYAATTPNLVAKKKRTPPKPLSGLWSPTWRLDAGRCGRKKTGIEPSPSFSRRLPLKAAFPTTPRRCAKHPACTAELWYNKSMATIKPRLYIYTGMIYQTIPLLRWKNQSHILLSIDVFDTYVRPTRQQLNYLIIYTWYIYIPF